MSREIKFRAWDKKHGEWVTGGIGYERHSGVGPRYFYVYAGNAVDVILQQYTGLKDKNGKEIYEGDIIRYVPLDPDGSPEGDGENFPVEWECWDDDCGWNIYPFQKLEYEVIGNIYENPDLLKDNKEKGD